VSEDKNAKTVVAEVETRIVQYLPSWFPGAHFQRFARATKDMTDELRNVPIELVKKAMVQRARAVLPTSQTKLPFQATHTAPPSLARNMLELVSPDNRAALQDIRNVCATVYIGKRNRDKGSDPQLTNSILAGIDSVGFYWSIVSQVSQFLRAHTDHIPNHGVLSRDGSIP
jgi:hypothetical protein